MVVLSFDLGQWPLFCKRSSAWFWNIGKMLFQTNYYRTFWGKHDKKWPGHCNLRFSFFVQWLGILGWQKCLWGCSYLNQKAMQTQVTQKSTWLLPSQNRARAKQNLSSRVVSVSDAYGCPGSRASPLQLQRHTSTPIKPWNRIDSEIPGTLSNSTKHTWSR